MPAPLRRSFRFPVPAFVLLCAPLAAQHPDDFRWQTVPNGLNSSVHALASYGGSMHVGGFFTTAGGVPIASVARFDGSSFFALDGGLAGGRGGGAAVVLELSSFGTALMLGGDFEGAGPFTTKGVASWNGASFAPFPGLANPGERITAIGAHAGVLYASGVFFTAGSQPAGFIASWNGSTWTPLGPDVLTSGLGDQAQDLVSYGGELVAGGWFTQAGGQPAARLASWNGTRWAEFGGGANGDVHDLATVGGELLAAGSFTSIGGVPANRIARWNGASWSSLGSGLNGTVRAVAFLHGKVFVGGSFTQAGGQPASGVAQWNGTSWAPLGSGVPVVLPGEVFALAAHGDSLVVGGLFTSAGGRPTQNLALWHDPVDTTPPTVTITSPGEGALFGASHVALAVTVSDASSTGVSSTPNGLTASLPAGGGSASGSVPLLSEGANLLVATAVDAFGNVGQAAVTVLRDTTAPAVTILTPTPGATFGNTTIEVTVEIVDASATSVVVGSESFSLPAGGGTIHVSVELGEGATSLTVVAQDAVGNTGSDTRALTIDLSAPWVTIDSPAAEPVPCFGPGEEVVTVAATVDDLTATDVLFQPGGAGGALGPGGGSLVRTVSLVEGTNVITVAATDTTGRVGTASLVAVLDTTGPTLAITSPLDGSIVRGASVELAVEAVDPAPGSGIALVELFLDGAPLTSFAAPPYEARLDSLALADGLHVLSARALDGKGNLASASPVELLVDNTAPRITLLTPAADGLIVSGTIDLDALVDDLAPGSGVTTVLLSAAGAPPTPLDPSFRDAPPASSVLVEGELDTTLLPDGPLAILVLARDAAGNESRIDRTVSVDNSAPPTCMLFPATGSQVSGTLVLEASVTGTFDSLELLVDGTSLATTVLPILSLPYDTTTRLDGPMVVEARVRFGSSGLLSCTSLLEVDNLAFTLTPGVLNLNSNGNAPIMARIEGPNVALLMPTEAHGLQLRACNGSPVPAQSGWAGDDHTSDEDRDGLLELKVRFERRLLVGAIQAGIASGLVQPGELVEVELWAGVTSTNPGTRIGTTSVRIVGN